MAKLSARQEKFIIALMTNNTIEQAYQYAGIAENTAYKYLRDPSFLEEYRRIRRETMQQVTSRLQQTAVVAVKTLEEVMTDKENSTPSSRVQAARAVLENAYKGIELDDIQEQLDQLKEVLQINGYKTT